MIAYSIPMAVCGGCGYPLMHVDPHRAFNAATKKGVMQVICAHRECPNYDKPMEFDMPQIELRPTTDPKILAEVDAPRLIHLNS